MILRVGAFTLLICASLAVGVQLSIGQTPEDPISPVDAVVVLAGSQDRLAPGLALVDEQVAPLMILSRGTSPWPDADDLCASGRDDVELICFIPSPDSTRGEAEEISRLAQIHSLDSIALVTSASHMRRASRWMDRCTDLEVLHHPVPDPARHNATREWLATDESLTIERACELG